MKLATYPEKVKPKEGDQRIDKRFAWWPRRVKNRLIWLESYNKVYEFKVRKRVIIARWLYHEGHWGDWDLITEQLIT